MILGCQFIRENFFSKNFLRNFRENKHIKNRKIVKMELVNHQIYLSKCHWLEKSHMSIDKKNNNKSYLISDL